MKNSRSESGQVVLVVMCFLAVFGLVAFVIGVSLFRNVRVFLQPAMDTVALTGAVLTVLLIALYGISVCRTGKNQPIDLWQCCSACDGTGGVCAEPPSSGASSVWVDTMRIGLCQFCGGTGQVRAFPAEAPRKRCAA